MALTAETITGKPSYTFPKLGYVPREVVLGAGEPWFEEKRRSRALVATTNLLAYSLARATGRDIAWQRRFFSESSHQPLDYLVQTVTNAEPMVRSGPATRVRDLESNLTATKAMVTAVASLDLLLQLRLGIQSKQAMKREARVRAIEQSDALKIVDKRKKRRIFRTAYKRELEILKFLNNDDTSEVSSDDSYPQWKVELRQKADRIHQLCLTYREQLHSHLNQTQDQ